MPRVHITQCLCSHRHCIAAIAWEEPDQTPGSAVETLKELIAEGVERGILNPWCGICDDHELLYEDGVTAFRSLREAMPTIIQTEKENLRAKLAFDVSRN